MKTISKKECLKIASYRFALYCVKRGVYDKNPSVNLPHSVSQCSLQILEILRKQKDGIRLYMSVSDAYKYYIMNSFEHMRIKTEGTRVENIVSSEQVVNQNEVSKVLFYGTALNFNK